MPHVKVFAAADTLLFLPVWLADHYGVMRRVADEVSKRFAVAPSHFEVAVPEIVGQFGDKACLTALIREDRRQSPAPAIGLCDPVSLFALEEQEDPFKDLSVVGTFLRQPPFWLVGFNIDNVGLGKIAPSLREATLIHYGEDFKTGHDLGDQISTKYGCHAYQIHKGHSVRVNNDLGVLLDLYNERNKDPAAPPCIALLTVDIVGVSRLVSALKKADPENKLKFGVVGCLANPALFPQFEKFLTTAIVANKAALSAGPGVVDGLICALQHSALILNASERVTASFVTQLTQAEYRHAISPGANSKDWPSTVGGVTLPYNDGPLDEAEGDFVAKQLADNKVFEPDMRLRVEDIQARFRGQGNALLNDGHKKLASRLYESSEANFIHIHFPQNAQVFSYLKSWQIGVTAASVPLLIISIYLGAWETCWHPTRWSYFVTLVPAFFIIATFAAGKAFERRRRRFFGLTSIFVVKYKMEYSVGLLLLLILGALDIFVFDHIIANFKVGCGLPVLYLTALLPIVLCASTIWSVYKTRDAAKKREALWQI